MNTSWLIFGVLLTAALIAWFFRAKIRRRTVPDKLRPGNTLPQFTAVNESGEALDSTTLRGSPAVLLFVRGSWCPFCSKQVADLTGYYKAITDSGARLILVTPRPLETTRRVADFFAVEFEFWLDESLAIAKDLGLVLQRGVPNDYNEEYGEDTVWPASIIIDSEGIIRYSELSRFVADRPDPEKLLAVVKNL